MACQRCETLADQVGQLRAQMEAAIAAERDRCAAAICGYCGVGWERTDTGHHRIPKKDRDASHRAFVPCSAVKLFAQK